VTGEEVGLPHRVIGVGWYSVISRGGEGVAATEDNRQVGVLEQVGAQLRLVLEPVLLYHDVWPYSGLHEAEFRKAVLHWDRPCVDTTAWALQAMHDGDKPTFQRRAGPRERDAIISFVRQHFDPNSGGFRQSTGVPASVYATHMAFNALKLLSTKPVPYYLTPLGKQRAAELLGTDGTNIVDASIQYVLDKHDPETGAFHNTGDRFPQELGVSVAHSACGLLWNLQALSGEIKETLTSFLVGGEGQRSVLWTDEEGHMGFKDSALDSTALSCSTYYALRTLRWMGRKAWIDEHRSAIESFLLACYSERDSVAGFSPSPGGRRTLSHTCLALVALVDLLRGPDGAMNCPDTVDLLKVRDYMERCRSSHGGFGFGRGPQVGALAWMLRPAGFRDRWYGPNVHMTRVVLCAVGLLKSVEGGFSEVTEDIADVLEIVDRTSYSGNGLQGWAGYPARAIAEGPGPARGNIEGRWYRLVRAAKSGIIDRLFVPRPDRSLRPQEYTPLPYAAIALGCFATGIGTSFLWAVRAARASVPPSQEFILMLVMLMLATLGIVSAAEVLLWRARH
jgi:hypothetical protein